MISEAEMEGLRTVRRGKPPTRALARRYYSTDPAEVVEFEAEKARKAVIIAKVRADMKLINKIFKGK